MILASSEERVYCELTSSLRLNSQYGANDLYILIVKSRRFSGQRLKIRLIVQYLTDQGGCKLKQSFNLPRGEECERIYKRIIDDC